MYICKKCIYIHIYIIKEIYIYLYISIYIEKKNEINNIYIKNIYIKKIK